MTDTFRDEMERFLALTKMKPTVFSVAATQGKDRHLVRSIRAGRRLWPDTQERIRRFMTEYAQSAHSGPASAE